MRACDNGGVGFKSLWLALVACVLNGQILPPVWKATDYAHLSKLIIAPKLEHPTVPEYTPQARAASIQGTVVLEAVISKEGRVTHASVLSPLPGGLDAAALKAVAQWRYAPATMDGELVPVIMPVDVVFRLPYSTVDHVLQHERQRLDEIARDADPSAAEVSEVKELARRGVVAAIGVLGRWEVTGSGVPVDGEAGFAALRFAAEQGDAGSLFFYGRAEVQGDHVGRNETHGWEWIRRAAYFGDAEAQRMLAEKDERAGDRNGAAWYFRMCAATAHADCEFDLGRLMVTGPGVNPNDFTQGVAWLELAKEHGNAAAKQLYDKSAAELSSLQVQWAADLKPHLELRRGEFY